MMPPGTLELSFARCSATRRFSASDSRTQGPAMRKKASPRRSAATLVRGVHQRGSSSEGALPFRCRCRRDESGEQWMRPSGPGLQLGVELTPNEPRMARQLDDLDQLAVG